MQRRVFIVHGWTATPYDNWFPWLGSELGALGIPAAVPQMPDTDNPAPSRWINALGKLVGTPDGGTCLVGHSIGASTVLKYLETLRHGRCGLAVLVAPWPNLPQVKNAAYSAMARRWMATEPNWASIRRHVGNVTVVFSTTDKYVRISNSRYYASALGAKVVRLEKRGHIVQDRCQPVLDAIKSFYGIA